MANAIHQVLFAGGGKTPDISIEKIAMTAVIQTPKGDSSIEKIALTAIMQAFTGNDISVEKIALVAIVQQPYP